jgi:RNA polymerase sigma factor (sigma-70 family)
MTATGNPALDAGEGSLQDSDLLASLRAGEDAAFGELFSRHADAVRRLARSLASDRSDAEDLTAEAFFRVLQAIRRGSGPNDNVRSYLLIVTRRVAWEWRERRRDVPVSDEILTHRVGPNPDTSGQAHERSLIARAFTSLPERWRSVLWKVEVEGERPAVVALNFGLSPNATAALARRARRGLRAAYLQAHLSTHQGSSGCRSVLEKLGAYTAGTVKGAERRRVRAHLVTCSSCQSTHDELVDVCAGLRSYAGIAAAPALMAGVLAHKTGLGAMLKGLLSSAGAKLSLAASSVLAAGVLGVVAGSPDSTPLAALDFNGGSGELSITQSELSHPAPVSGSLSSSIPSTGHARPVVGRKQDLPGPPVNTRLASGGGVPDGQPENVAQVAEEPSERGDVPVGSTEETTIQLATPVKSHENTLAEQPTTCIGAAETSPDKSSNESELKPTEPAETTSVPKKTPVTSTSTSPPATK